MDMYLLTSLALLSLCGLAVLGVAIDHYRQRHAHHH